MDAVRFGYVGCGGIAQMVHLPNFATVPNMRFEAIAEVRPKLCAQIAAKYGIPKQYASHEELCADREITAVGVSAPFETQGLIARDLLRAGKAVFMEKPMAVSIAQAEEILAAEKEGGGRLMVAYMKRYDAGNELAKKYVAGFRKSGELGPVTYLRAHGFGGQQWTAGNSGTVISTDEKAPPPVQGHLPSWLPEKNRKGYVGYLQQYTHNLNLLRWLMDAGDISVRSVDFDAQDGMSGIVVLDVGGARAVIESGGVTHWGWDEHTQVYFRDGWVRLESPPLLLKNTSARVEVYRAGTTQELSQPMPAKPDERWSWSYWREAAQFIECVRTGAPFESSGRDTLHDVRAFEAIYRKYLGLD